MTEKIKAQDVETFHWTGVEPYAAWPQFIKDAHVAVWGNGPPQEMSTSGVLRIDAAGNETELPIGFYALRFSNGHVMIFNPAMYALFVEPAAPPVVAPPVVVQPPSSLFPGLLAARITIAGVIYEYGEDAGKDMGDFVSEIGKFTQRCIRVAADSVCPLIVFFRPDRTSGRVEVVFELGTLFGGVPANLGFYTVEITRGAVSLAKIDVPVHYWLSRWRWQSAPRPVVGNVARLIAANLLPPYLPSFGQSVQSPAAVYSIMGLAGVTAYMPTTGERDDLGLVTEPQAKYICTGDANALATLRAQGEAAGTVPWHMRDENTGAPISFVMYPKACWYQDRQEGTPFVKTSIAPVPTPITIDDAHQPALAYVPYLLTGDPYHLEDLQFAATWNYGSFSLGYRPTLSQARQFAWSMRTLAQTVKMTPVSVPSWLLPQAYWRQMLGAHRTFFDSYINDASPPRAIFRAADDIANSGPENAKVPAGVCSSPWMSEFLAACLGWVVDMGFDDWRPAFDWAIASTIARTSITSGWVRAWATPYRLVLRPTSTAPYAKTWAEAWGLTSTLWPLTFSDPNSWANTDDMTYLTYTRGALVYAKKLGVVSIDENLAWATGQLVTKKWKTPYKWSLGSGL